MIKTSRMVTLTIMTFALGACGSDPAEGSRVGGMTECTEEAVGKSAMALVKSRSEANHFVLDNLECAEGWAVASGMIGPVDAPEGGPQGAPTSLIFQQEGAFWIPKDKPRVCGTLDPAAPLERPMDAEVPAALWLSGCAAG